MKREDFGANAPGQVVSTRFWVERMRGGVPERVSEDGEAFVPDALPPKLDWDRTLSRLLGTMLEATTELGKLEGRASRLANPALLIGPFQRREARMSSLIEDTIATPEELALVASGATMDGEDPLEVHNYVLALNQGLASELPVSNRLIRELHATLVRGVRGDRELPGEFRREQNFIGNRATGHAGARFVPPPNGEQLERCMAEFERFVNRPPEELPGLVVIALAHYQFECIHPFRDGNGRLGRLLMAIMLCRGRHISKPMLYMSDYFRKYEEEYKDLLLRVSTHGEFEEWIRFVLRGFAVQARDAATKLDRLSDLRENMHRRVTKKQASALRIKLIDSLFGSPAVTVPRVKDILGVTTTAAREHVKALVAAKILIPVAFRGRAPWYIARQILDAGDDGQDVTGKAED